MQNVLYSQVVRKLPVLRNVCLVTEDRLEEFATLNKLVYYLYWQHFKSLLFSCTDTCIMYPLYATTKSQGDWAV